MWIYGSHVYFTTAQVVFITAKIAFIFTSLSEVQIYDFHIFTFVYSPLHGFIWYQNNDQLPVEIGLLAQMVEHCTGIVEAMGSNSVQAWIFFRPYFHDCSSSVYYCEDRFHIHIFCSVETSPEIGSRDSADMHNVQLQKGIPTICWLESARTQDPLRRYGTGDEATDSFTMAVILIWKVLLSAFSDSSGWVVIVLV